MEPESRKSGDSSLDPRLVRKIRIGLYVAGAIIVLGTIVAVVLTLREDKVMGRWDDFAAIKQRFEFQQDPLFEDPGGVYREQRNRYIASLEQFVTAEAESEDDALAPHVHWLIAKVSADQVISMKDVFDLDERDVHYGRIEKHLEILRDKYPDFQTNWLEFAPTGHANLTRSFLDTMTANRDWEASHFPGSKVPDENIVVLVRTERGDLRLGLYTEDARRLTERLLSRAVRGEYDGTSFFAKSDQGSDDDPIRRSVRGGSPTSRSIMPFIAEDAARLAETAYFEPLVPAPSRHRIVMERGIVAGWHDPTNPYDGSPQLLVVTGRSPQLDYTHSPIGKLLDAESLATADRIFESRVWGDEHEGEPTEELATIRDFLQDPVRIVKVLVYENGVLEAPAGESAVPTKADVDESENRLETVKSDAYRRQPAERPVAPPPPGETDGGDTAPPDEGAGDD